MNGKGKGKANGSGKGKARGRVQLQRIENRASRQVSFSKRRTGLMKKAHELAVLCDADVAVLVFSDKGKLYEFAGPSSMEKIIERYQQFSEAERDANRISLGLKLPPKGSLCASTNSELLEIAQRSFDETNTALLSVKELGRIEKELGGAFRQDMSRKTQQMADMIAQLQQKGKELLDDIKSLKSIETTAAPKGPKRGKDYSSSGKDPASVSNHGDCGFSSEQQPWMSPVPLALSLTLSIHSSQGGSSLHNAPNLNSYSLPKT